MSEDEQEAEAEQAQDSGIVYLDWIPRIEEGPNRSQRISGVVAVEVRDPLISDEYHQGELVLHQEDGVAAYDLRELRGFRAQEGVRVPQYEQPDSRDSGSHSGGA
jgi:hypothetical protein